MKTIKLTLVALATILSVASCNKNETNPLPTSKDGITADNYTQKSGAKEGDEDGTTTIYVPAHPLIEELATSSSFNAYLEQRNQIFETMDASVADNFNGDEEAFKQTVQNCYDNRDLGCLANAYGYQNEEELSIAITNFTRANEDVNDDFPDLDNLPDAESDTIMTTAEYIITTGQVPFSETGYFPVPANVFDYVFCIFTCKQDFDRSSQEAWEEYIPKRDYCTNLYGSGFSCEDTNGDPIPQCLDCLGRDHDWLKVRLATAVARYRRCITVCK